MVPEGWSKHRFGDVTRIANGQVDPKVEPYASLPHIGPENVVSNSGQIIDVKTCSELGLISGKYKFDENALVYSKIRPHLNKVCKPGFKGVCSADMYPIWANDELSSEYLLHYMLSEHFVSRAVAMSMRTGMPKINRNDMTCLSIVVPPVQEQKKIAKILSTWDKAIATVEKLIANSQQQRKAFMQQLLTGKKRLPGFGNEGGTQQTRYGLVPGDWGFVHIEDVAVQVSKKNVEALELPVLSCSKHDGFVDSLQYFNKKVYSDDTSGYKVVERGCFGFPSNHIEEGSIGYQNIYDAGLVSPIYTVFRPNPKKVDSFYLYKLLKTEHYRQIFSAATNASVDRRGSLRWKEFGKIRIPLPTLTEQQKIASILSASENEVAVQQQSLEGIKQEKKALMQQLLTGKRRVTVS